MHFTPLPLVVRESPISSQRFDHPNNIWTSKQREGPLYEMFIKFYFLPLKSDHFCQHPILETPLAHVFPLMFKSKFYTHIKRPSTFNVSNKLFSFLLQSCLQIVGYNLLERCNF